MLGLKFKDGGLRGLGFWDVGVYELGVWGLNLRTHRRRTQFSDTSRMLRRHRAVRMEATTNTKSQVFTPNEEHVICKTASVSGRQLVLLCPTP